MARRVSKKLLVGLGSTLTFGTVGVVGGFGIKSLVDVVLNSQNNQFQINTLAETAYTNAPDYNVATGDMFVDTSNLKRFHFGNTLIGQTVTPYGWLGVFDEGTKATRIALTGWNGEVLWVNEPTNYESGVNLHNYDVYDMEYDFNNDLIMVLRTWSANGLINNNDENLPPIRLDFLDAKTGKAFEGSVIKWKRQGDADTTYENKWQEKALGTLKTEKYLDWGNVQNKAQSKNLYQLDVASAPGKKNFLVTWMPDFMRLTKNFGKSNASLITLRDFIKIWNKVAVSFIVDPTRVKNDSPANYSRYFDLVKSNQINTADKIDLGSGDVSTDQFYLIANPFFTVGSETINQKGEPNNKNVYIMHIIFADKDQNVYHKTIGWKENIDKPVSSGELWNSGKYDKVQKVDWKKGTPGFEGNTDTGFLVEKDRKGGLPSWTKRQKYTDPSVINANTRINKNMFDNNSVVFAYPFGSGTHLNTWFSIFNVAQMYVNPADGKFFDAREKDLKKKPKQFYFGRDIEGNNQKVAHYPGQNGKNNINQTYHRLISVSPFDNTFIFASKPNFQDSFFNQGANNNEKNWAGFFIGKTFRTSNVVRPFFIWNATRSNLSPNSGPIDSTMTSVEKLYDDGFTFDLRSFVTTTNGGARPGLNLYFNQNGNLSGTTESNGIKSRKIGMITDIFRDLNLSNLWIDSGKLGTQIAGNASLYNAAGVKIDQNSFSTLNHSRANLEKWYPRTWLNSTSPSNSMAANFVLNSGANEHQRAIAKKFNSKLTDAEFSNNKSVDLVSVWKDNKPNYDRLIVKRPLIKVKNTSPAEKLPVVTEYNYANENDLKANVWIPRSGENLNKTNLVIRREEDLPNVSFEIFSSWKDQFRMQSIGNETNSLNPTMNSRGTAQWIDKRNNSSLAVFGKSNNAISKNNKIPLRLMLKIVKPTNVDNNLPLWFKNNLGSKFFNAYPVEAVSGETSFAQILQEFLRKKTESLDMGDSKNSNLPVGLGNLKIEAFLGLNPNFMSNPDRNIYTNSNKKMIYDTQTGQRIIYDDKYNGNHTIYDQSQINYDQFNSGGFGNSVSAVVQESWLSTINQNNKIKVNIDANLLKNTLVRKDANNQKLFDFDYETGNQNLLVRVLDKAWLRPRLLNFQRLINMKLRFEFQTETNKNWQTLITANDTKMKELWPTDSDTFKLPTTNTVGINKIRMILIPNDDNDRNSFVKMSNYNPSDQKFISTDHVISTQKVVINKAWFNQVKLSNATNSLMNLRIEDFNTFEDNIFRQMPEIGQSPSLRNKIQLVYKWNNENTTITKDQLFTKITNAFSNFSASDGGVFALWNGTNGINIKATFQALDTSIQFVKPDNSTARPEDYSDILVQSTIQSEFNLGTYISKLQSSPLAARMGSNPGTIVANSIQFPNNSGTTSSEKFGGRTFAQIKQLLANVGIKIKFKQWTNNNWSNWLDDENQITNYNLSKPEFQIGFHIDSNWNVKLFNGSSVIPNQGSYTLKLNLPKIVKIPQNTQQMVNNFLNQNPFDGNTYQLTVNNIDNAKQQITNALIQASTNSANEYSALHQNLVLKFKLGNSDWLEANDLKQYLKTQGDSKIDQPSNSLLMKIDLKPSQQDFILETSFANQREIALLQDQNPKIKIYLHGKKWEDALKLNNIAVSGDRNNLSYQLPTELSEFSTNGLYNDKQLTLQYALVNNLNNSANLKWINGFMPSQVASDIQGIKVRIGINKTWNDNEASTRQIFIYGPESTSQQAMSTINLAQIPTKILVNKQWFQNEAITSTEIELRNLNSTLLNSWEEKIWARSQVPNNLKSRVVIKYSFLGHSNLTKDNLGQKLIEESRNYQSSVHHGIFKLHDPTIASHNGIKISATFEKVVTNDPLIQFVDANGLVIDNDNSKRTGDVNTQKITNTVDLSDYINFLETNKAAITTNGNTPGTITPGTLTPPAANGNPANNLFAGVQFNKVEEWLAKAGIFLIWSPNGQNDWKTTKQVNSYDPRKGFLFFAIHNNSTNLKIKLDALNSLNPNESSFNRKEIKIKLNAPKVITGITPDLVSTPLLQNNVFSGNTKEFRVDTNKVKTLVIQKILEQNANSSSNNEFYNAPLRMMVQVGDEAFYDYEQVSGELSKLTTDVSSGLVTVKFQIDPNSPNASEWIIAPASLAEFNVFPGQSPIKVYINENNISNDLRKTTFGTGSTTNNLIWSWPANFSVNDQSGELTINNPVRGKGLRVEYTFNESLTTGANQPVGSNPQTQWVRIKPTSFNLTNKKVFLRLQVTNQQIYTYEKENNPEKIELDLASIKQIIQLDGNWLNKIPASANVNLDTFNLDQYESAVFNSMTGFDQATKDKIQIIYNFNGKSNLTKTTILNEIQNYKNLQTVDKNFGILQLRNQAQQGELITASFSKKDLNGNYDFVYVDNKRDHQLDTSKVITTIDLNLVGKWLEEIIKVDVVKGTQPNTISSLRFSQPIVAAGTPFNNKQWSETEKVLKQLAIKVEYQEVAQGVDTNIWYEDINAIKKYDGSSKFKLRFKLLGSLGQNIVLKIKNTNIEGVSQNIDKPSDALDIRLNIPKQITINQNWIDNFKNNSGLSGNTKNLDFNQTKIDELIRNIKSDQVNSSIEGINQVGLQVEFSLGNNGAYSSIDELKKNLSKYPSDQPNNQISIRFVLNANSQTEWIIDPDNRTYEILANGNTNVPIYVHDTGLLDKIKNETSITGTNENLNWTFPRSNDFTITDTNEIAANSRIGKGLKLDFSLKTNPDINQDNDWQSDRPLSVLPSQKSIAIRIKTKSANYVYEKQLDKSNQPLNIPLVITKKLIVNADWIKNNPFANSQIEINEFLKQGKTLIQQWITQIQNSIKDKNQIDLDEAKKVTIKFSYKNQSNLDIDQLINFIKSEINNTNVTLGIVQLWNGNLGEKITGTFASTDKSITLEAENNSNKLSETINTTNIYTNIDLKEYIKVLESTKTIINHQQSAAPGTMDSFNPPQMPTTSGGQFAGKNYDEISRTLEKVGITIEFSSDKQTWTAKNQTKKYDLQNAALYLAFTNQANNNIKLLVNGNTQIEAGNSNKNNPIRLPLNVPKQINIIDSDLTNILNLNFTDNTKNIKFNEQEVANIINAILQRNATQTNDNSFKQAPLVIEFQIGNNGVWKESKDLKAYLIGLDTDFTNRSIKYRFKINNQNNNEWELSSGSDTERELYTDNNSPLKIYINDNGILEGLKATKFSGSNTQLNWIWQNGITVNDQTGKLLKQDANRTSGNGLKIAYSFDQKTWQSNKPTSFKPTDRTVYLKFLYEDSNKYIYDNFAEIINLTLDLPITIELNKNWLNQTLFNENEKTIDEFVRDAQTILDNYEKLVFQNAMNNGSIDDLLKTKFKIEYSFENSLFGLSKSDLINKLREYKNNNSNATSLGILQLWNGTSGIKIQAKFADVDANDNFNINVTPDNNGQILDTTKVKTTIDFSTVLTWLQTFNGGIPIDPGSQPNSISKIKIPNVNAPGTPFDNKSWEQVENSLNNFGITIQYRPDRGNNNSEPWKPLDQINSYDPNSGLIQFKFLFNNAKAKNIKLKLTNTIIHDGSAINESAIYEFKLKVKLTLIIDQLKINEFIQNSDIKGNTKFISINETAAQKLINDIKSFNEQNNSEFAKADLKLEYYLGSENDSNIIWKEWASFKKDLEISNLDQRSNRVIFRLAINSNQNDQFAVSNTTYVLHNDRQSIANWKVKFYINKANWENNAKNITISGTSSNVFWNYNAFGSANVVEDIQTDGSKKVFLKNATGQKAFQIQFSTKKGIQYNDNNVSDQLNDITSKWVTVEPQQFLDDWNVEQISVRLVPTEGYIYEAKEDQSAKAYIISFANLKLEIKVNPTVLKTALIINKNPFIHEISETDIQQFIDKALATINPNLKNNVLVNFKFKNDATLLSAKKLVDKIKVELNIKNGKPFKIVQLWNDVIGDKVEAQFKLTDQAAKQYVLIDSQNANLNAERFETVETKNIKTAIDLKSIVKDLKQEKINVTLTKQNQKTIVAIQNLIMPGVIPAGDNSSELQGLTWEKFESKLNSFGIEIEARAKVGPNLPQKNWSPISAIREYDDTILKLELRFNLKEKLKTQNLVLSVNADNDLESSTNNLPIFEMSLNAPAKVVVNPDLINTFKSSDIFSGNTKNIEIKTNPEEELINKIISENIANNPDIFNQLNGRLEVQYYLGISQPLNESDWRSATEFKSFLASQTTDQRTNEIWFRLNILASTNPNDQQIFQVDQTPIVLLTEDISGNAKVKIYVHETGFSDAIRNLKANGSTEQFNISGLDQWRKLIPSGLEVWYSVSTNPNEDNDDDWSDSVPTKLLSDKKLWIRFKVKPGYIFQNAKANNANYGEKHEVDTSGIKVILNVKTDWLKNIIITGNTKEATLDETKVLKEIQDSGILPNGQTDLIQLQYRIIGTNDWLLKSDFENKLQTLNGKKDDKNFILKREDLQVRFNIKGWTKIDGDYGLNIDGENIDVSNRDQYNLNLVNANEGRNDNFKGYINLDHLTDFVLANFKVVGTTSQPRLIITKREQLNSLFMPYVSDHLFDIQFSTVQNQDGSWNWNDSNSILNNGQLIDPDGLIGKVQIGADKKFALRFVAKNDKYEIHKNNALQAGGYILDISQNVIITVEITNPFTNQNKVLRIWTREKNGAKYQQGQGGFKIVTIDESGNIDQNNLQSAQQFLANSQLKPVEKDALEFAYTVFEQTPSQSQIDEAIKEINNYETNTWKSLTLSQTDDWSDNLGLKVGNYVAVGLRVKQTHANNPNAAFTLDNNSIMLPIINSEQPGRIAGYQISTNLINISADNISLFNNDDSTLPPIDGYTSLNKIRLNSDADGQYLGVDLDLKVYSEFHLNANNGILIAPISKQRLIKRDNTGITSAGNYKNPDGTDLKDKDGNSVPILRDQNNRLAKPIKGQTRLQPLENLGNGEFKLPASLSLDESEKLSFFRNQDIDVKLKGAIGQGTADLPDYYADNERVIELKDLISPRIKFVIDNDKNVKYEWPQDEFNPDQIKYVNADNSEGPAKDGNAQVATILKIKRWQNNQEQDITGNNVTDAIAKLQEMLDADFNKQLKFQINYQQANGTIQTYNGNNIYQLKSLKNRDRITVRIVATDDDLYYTGEPNPLVINVNGLVELAPREEQLQYLRVEQSGQVEGKGSFRVLATDPSIPGQTNEQVLAGWKFMLRVWDKNKEIKIEWTDDQSRINNLENGDRIEWKLVSADGNPVDKAYYNTVAQNHQYDENNQIKYNFAKVNYPKGESSKQVVESNIGQYPTTDQYPEDSGYVIAGLKPVAELFKISSDNLSKIFKVLNPTYVGLNHQGTINFDNQYLNNHYYVNNVGEIYQKLPTENNLLADDNENDNNSELNEITVEQLLDNTIFYNEDPVLSSYQNGFKFSDNTVNINNHLSNGDQIWAQFGIIQTNSTSSLNSGVTVKLNQVSGLKSTSDPMSPMWYVLMTLAGIITLGVSGIIVYVKARHKKLKG